MRHPVSGRYLTRSLKGIPSVVTLRSKLWGLTRRGCCYSNTTVQHRTVQHRTVQLGVVTRGGGHYGNNTTVQHRIATQQCSTAHHPPCSPPFLLTLESLSLAQTVVVGALLESLSLAQTGSDPGIRLRGDLPKWRASSLDWCANPPGYRRESGRPPTCSELACCGRRPPRVVIVVIHVSQPPG